VHNERKHPIRRLSVRDRRLKSPTPTALWVAEFPSRIEMIELAKLGLRASTATIRKYRPRARRQPSQSWRTFLQNHAAGIAAMNFFVVPTVTARLLYVLVVMHNERRKIVHFNITDAPAAA